MRHRRSRELLKMETALVGRFPMFLSEFKGTVRKLDSGSTFRGDGVVFWMLDFQVFKGSGLVFLDVGFWFLSGIGFSIGFPGYWQVCFS